MHLVYPVALGSLLFSVGIYGVLARRNAVLILMSIEIMLNAVNINLVAFNAWLRDPLMGGQIFALFVITVAAAEVGVGLAIVLLIFRNRETVDLDHLRELSDVQPVRTPRAAAAPEEASVR
ncbi:MAG: NADH-quinone oxidoreductase subunit [Frankiaceae bacterium]|jgi:NADH-quinone oxidoreductase subunit K|nr:NADH-quinone oxidoreductase subunit [Frankiaceae bacterium]